MEGNVCHYNEFVNKKIKKVRLSLQQLINTQKQKKYIYFPFFFLKQGLVWKAKGLPLQGTC